MRREPITGDPKYLQKRGFARAVAKLAAVWRKAWTPRIPPDIVAWAEGGGIIMPAAVAARGNGGRLSFASRPYWRQALRWFVSPGVETIIIVVASQCGKTTLNIVVALFSAEFLPGPFLFLTATEDLADELVRDRLKPIFKASPFGKGLKANDLRLDGASFPGGGSLHVVAVGSPSAIKSRPARGGAFDEFDESFHRNKHLGCPLGRFKTRTRTYGSLGRHIVTSTPVNDSEGIWTEYEKSRRHEWRCPCPYCGHYQALELSQIKWPRNAQGDSSETPERIGSLGLAWYECVNCKGKWDDLQKRKAVSSGVVYCLDPEKGISQVGMHISVLYSPDVSLSKIAEEFLNSVDDPAKLKQFKNEWLAEPIREIVKTSSTDQGHLATLGFDGYQQPAPDWWRGDETPQAPEFVRAITWGFDVQGSEVWGLCRGWGDHGENIVLWCGKFAGTTDLDDAAVAFRREWIIQGGELARPRRGLMDSGYRTHEVYRVCARTPGLLPSKGRQDGTLPMSMSQVDRQDQNRRTVGRVELAIVWTTYWQDQVEASLGAGPGRGRGVCHLPQNPPSFLYRHLLAERKTAVRSRNGTIAYVWKAHSHENHLRDCIVYSTAAAGHANLLDMRPRKAMPVEVASTPQALAVPAPPQNTPKRAETALSRLIKARSAGAIKLN